MDFMKCPWLWRKGNIDLLPNRDSAAFALGEATHVRTLEGLDVFNSRYTTDALINPTTGKPYGVQTKKYADWKRQQKRIVLTPAQGREIANMAAGVASHPDAAMLLSTGQAEGVVRGIFEGMECQIRIDWFHPHYGIIDLKTCQDLTWFEADARRYRYDIQTTFYREVFHAVTGVYVPVHIIAIEKQEPYRCGVWEVTKETHMAALRKIKAAIAEFKDCQKAKHWPTRFEDVRKLDIF